MLPANAQLPRRRLDVPHAPQVVQLEDIAIEFKGLSDHREVQRRQLRAAWSIRPARLCS